MKVETHLAANSNNDEEMLWVGRAGVQLAAYVIALDSNQPYDALNQIWAGGPGSGSETNSALMGLDLNNYPVGYPNTVGTVSIKIKDLERYVNINIASPQLIQQVLTAQGVDPDRISVVSDSVLDWIDTDDAHSPRRRRERLLPRPHPAVLCEERAVGRHFRIDADQGCHAQDVLEYE